MVRALVVIGGVCLALWFFFLFLFAGCMLLSDEYLYMSVAVSKKGMELSRNSRLPCILGLE